MTIKSYLDEYERKKIQPSYYESSLGSKRVVFMFCHSVNCLACNLSESLFGSRNPGRAGLDVRGALGDQPGGEKRFGRLEEGFP